MGSLSQPRPPSFRFTSVAFGVFRSYLQYVVQLGRRPIDASDQNSSHIVQLGRRPIDASDQNSSNMRSIVSTSRALYRLAVDAVTVGSHCYTSGACFLDLLYRAHCVVAPGFYF
jgi:hypothetical protein